MSPKILMLDVETAPHLAHVWGLWQQNVGLPQIIDAGYVLCWSAKWYGENEIYFDSVQHNDVTGMLAGIRSLLNKADIVVHFNGTKFDIPTLNKEFILHKFPPPSPYRQIDLLKTARDAFKFPSNKLDYIVQALGLGQKIKHRGHELWIACMNGDKQAWKEMQEYNMNDVTILEKLYDNFKPWIKGHPNIGLYTEEEVCPTCGNKHLQRRGFTYTAAGKYQRYRCKTCGAWSREFKNVGKRKYTAAH